MNTEFSEGRSEMAGEYWEKTLGEILLIATEKYKSRYEREKKGTASWPGVAAQRDSYAKGVWGFHTGDAKEILRILEEYGDESLGSAIRKRLGKGPIAFQVTGEDL